MPILNRYRTASHGPRTASLAFRSLPRSNTAAGARCVPGVSIRSADAGNDEIHTVALHLFLCAVVITVASAQPGFVPDEFLSGVKDDIDLAIVELCDADIWQRTTGGYQIPIQRLRQAVAMLDDMGARQSEPPTTR